MKKKTALEVAFVGLGAFVGFAVLKTLTALSAAGRDFDVLYSVHGADLRFGSEDDVPRPKTLLQARSQAEGFVLSMQSLQPHAVVMNLRTGEAVAQF